MLFIRNGRFWNTDYPVLILKTFESSLPTKSWTESAILFSQLNFSVQLNRTLPATMYYLFTSKSSRKLWMLEVMLIPSLPPPPPPPTPSFSRIFLNFIIAMFWHSVGIFWNYYRYHHFRTDRTFSVVVTPPNPSSFLWLQTELDSTQSYSDHYLSHEICLCMYSIVKKTRKWCLPTQKKFLRSYYPRKKFLQVEYSPTSSPITSQHQQQQQQQQSFICVTMQVHTVLQKIIIIIIS